MVAAVGFAVMVVPSTIATLTGAPATHAGVSSALWCMESSPLGAARLLTSSS
jgi:hypothetical protein